LRKISHANIGYEETDVSQAGATFANHLYGSEIRIAYSYYLFIPGAGRKREMKGGTRMSRMIGLPLNYEN
jgi:hypothetical protein